MRSIAMGVLACLAMSACAHTVKPATQNQKNLGSVAASPLKDVGLIRPEAPRQLSDIAYPYDRTRLTSGCAQISYEIGALDALLGPEFYAAPRSTIGKAGQAAFGAAEGAASGLIPFRGVVRSVSGANKSQADVERAVQMGVLRRAFLRGYGAAQGCSGMFPEAAGEVAPAPSPASSPTR